MVDNIYFILGKNVRRLRTKASYTIKELSEKAKIDRTTLIDLEKGRSNPLISTLLKISNVLKLDVCKFFSGF